MGTVAAARQRIQAFSRVMIPPPGPVRIFQKNLASQVRSDQEVLEISRNRIRRYWTSRRSNQEVFKPRGSFIFFFHHHTFPLLLNSYAFWFTVSDLPFGQAAVTGGFPSSPRCLPSFLSRIGFSQHPRLYSPIFIEMGHPDSTLAASSEPTRETAVKNM